MEIALSHLTSYEGFEFAEYLSISTLGFTIYYSKESNICYTLMIDVNYLLYLQPLHKVLPFSPKKREINGVNKLLCTFYDKKYYVCQIEYYQYYVYQL